MLRMPDEGCLGERENTGSYLSVRLLVRSGFLDIYPARSHLRPKF